MWTFLGFSFRYWYNISSSLSLSKMNRPFRTETFLVLIISKQPKGIVLVVVVPPIPLGGVRPLYFHRIVIVYRTTYTIFEVPNLFRFDNFVVLSNDNRSFGTISRNTTYNYYSSSSGYYAGSQGVERRAECEEDRHNTCTRGENHVLIRTYGHPPGRVKQMRQYFDLKSCSISLHIIEMALHCPLQCLLHTWQRSISVS